MSNEDRCLNCGHSKFVHDGQSCAWHECYCTNFVLVSSAEEEKCAHPSIHRGKDHKFRCTQCFEVCDPYAAHSKAVCPKCVKEICVNGYLPYELRGVYGPVRCECGCHKPAPQVSHAEAVPFKIGQIKGDDDWYLEEPDGMTWAGKTKKDAEHTLDLAYHAWQLGRASLQVEVEKILKVTRDVLEAHEAHELGESPVVPWDELIEALAQYQKAVKG